MVVRDTHTTGLMVAVNRHSKSYKVQRDLWRGQRGRRKLIKTVRRNLGTTEEMSLDEARTRRGGHRAGQTRRRSERVLRRALETGDVLHPGTPWLFPTRNKKGERIATRVWKERSLPSKTGHILRHTYRTLAHAAGIPTTDVQLLMDHKVPGVTGVYLHDRALFDHLLGQQEQVSSYILELAQVAQRQLV